MMRLWSGDADDTTTVGHPRVSGEVILGNIVIGFMSQEFNQGVTAPSAHLGRTMMTQYGRRP